MASGIGYKGGSARGAREIQSMRNDLIERMAAMKSELIRWTVGSFVAFAAFFFAAMSFLR